MRENLMINNKRCHVAGMCSSGVWQCWFYGRARGNEICRKR